MKTSKRKIVTHGVDKSVEETPESYGWNEWTVYDEYAIGEEQGRRYIYAPDAKDAYPYKPLSRPTASLFLEFARWPETEGMDRRPLDTDRNAEAAREWSPGRGILGTDPPDFAVWGGSSQMLREFLGGVGPGILRGRGSYNDASGGPGETVARFAVEAWKANAALRLYDAATRPAGPDTDTIVALMPDRRDEFKDRRFWSSVRDIHGRTPETARSWALSTVEEIVEGEVRGHCWPIPVRRNDGSHGQGWAFDSLLGAMWLQMLWLMLGDARRCDWCGRVLDVDPEEDLRTTGDGGAGKAGGRKPPSHKRFCKDTGGRCKANWNYHHGTGNSSKAARKAERDREKSGES